MAKTETIKEFLVRLGFQTDEAGLKKFESGLNKATKSVFALAAAIEATAVGIAAAVAVFASNLEALYFAAQRTGSAAVNLKALDLAAQNFGTSAGEALASVEGLAHALRVNPGNEGLLNGLLTANGQRGMRDAKGNLRDLTDVMLDLAKVFQNQPVYLSEQYAGLFGISENMMLAMRNGDFANDVARVRAEINNTDWKKATEDAHEFEKQFRDIKITLEALGTVVVDALQKKFGGSLKDLNAWIQSHRGEISDWIIDAATTIQHGAEGIVTSVKAISAEYEHLLGVATKVGQFFADHAPRKLVDEIGDSINEDLHTMGLISDEDYKRGKNYYEQTYGLPDISKGKDETRDSHWWQQVMDHFISPETQARQSLEKVFTPAQIAGILANLQVESQLDPNAVGDNGAAIGIAQWHKPGQERFKKWSGGLDMEHSTRAQQIAFLMADLQANKGFMDKFALAQDNADLAGRTFSLGYEKPRDAQGEADRRGALATRISQHTTIHVDGAHDPAATAHAVAKEQGRVNADLQRNVASVVAY